MKKKKEKRVNLNMRVKESVKNKLLEFGEDYTKGFLYIFNRFLNNEGAFITKDSDAYKLLELKKEIKHLSDNALLSTTQLKVLNKEYKKISMANYNKLLKKLKEKNNKV